ncbi:MAG: biotin/lipoyl-binding protein [Bacteroidia bacterium]|nr:biotin/lipoyl-binding protein [Bacteroidales bacterium]NCD43121.1 biotin/lipoyl-binding protein [Bacteroidia bacterium]MDD3011747.1 biotin/lipoyl-binding protein [Bacteroidales bacterium]MDD3960656.1 biotin/lipoyl-binding protein [Bacteroidales bacterium]MDY0286931.1 biotin/lipoyl-containing protein [Bacteroidales bacterium]
MKKYSFTISGNTYDVVIQSFDENIAKIEVNGTRYDVEIHRNVPTSKTPTLARPAVPTRKTNVQVTAGSGAHTIKAPLPGNILSVLVKEGEAVAKGQKLLVYEAMKMENDVLAEHDGIVKSIKISVGDSVLQGDTLIEIG